MRRVTPPDERLRLASRILLAPVPARHGVQEATLGAPGIMGQDLGSERKAGSDAGGGQVLQKDRGSCSRQCGPAALDYRTGRLPSIYGPFSQSFPYLALLADPPYQNLRRYKRCCAPVSEPMVR